MNSDPKYDYEKHLISEKIRNTNQAFEHPSYVLEKRLCQAIIKKNREEALNYLDRINLIGRAELSRDPLRSLKNSLIGSCTIFTRAAIEGGLDSETAFTLSDLFIREIELISHSREIPSFEKQMLLAFIDALQTLRVELTEANFSPLISRTREYIRQHSMQRISLNEIAKQVNVHPNYLSNQFSKEVGQSIMSYYDELRINSIIHYLQYSQLSLSEIAIILDFSSFPHFSSYFKKNTGKTPREYRRLLND